MRSLFPVSSFAILVYLCQTGSAQEQETFKNDTISWEGSPSLIFSKRTTCSGTCAQCYGAGSIYCGTNDACFNPTIGESCCAQGGYNNAQGGYDNTQGGYNGGYGNPDTKNQHYSGGLPVAEVYTPGDGPQKAGYNGYVPSHVELPESQSMHVASPAMSHNYPATTEQ